MTVRVYRHVVPVDDQTYEFELHSDPLGVSGRKIGSVEFWALNQDDKPGTKRYFKVVGTGHPIDFEGSHWGVVVDPDGYLVWHLMEVL